MGVQGLFSMLAGVAKPITLKGLRGQRLGVDASCEIYRASLGIAHLDTLTDDKKVPTAFLSIILQKIATYKKSKVAGLIYVFDNDKPNLLKSATNKKRRDVRDGKVEKQAFSMTAAMIDSLKHMLTLLGVAWIVAPEGYEAEHMGAKLCEMDIIDKFVTSDSDALVFGATSIIRQMPKSKLVEYKLQDVFNQLAVDRKTFAHACVMLGCDFAKKTKGIGIARVMNKLDTPLTAEQQTAKDYFLSDCGMGTINSSIIDKPALITWLLDKGFGEQRLIKTLSVFV